MTRRDIPVVAELEREIYPEPWAPRVFFDELAQPNRSYVVALDAAGEIVGYAGMLRVEEDAHITTLAIDPGARRAKLGTRLMLSLVDEARDAGARHLTLEVRMSNTAAQQLYRRFGFAPVGLRKNYYRTEDALIMWAIDIDTADYEQRVSAIHASLAAESSLEDGDAS